MKKFNFVMPAMIFFAVMLNGCINVDQRIKINEDGSGTINLHYWTKSSYLSNGEMNMGDDIAGYNFMDYEIKRKYNSPVSEITNMKRYVDNKDSMTHIDLTISFKDFNKLSEAPGFARVKTEWTKGEDGMNFKYIMTRDTTIKKKYIVGDEKLNYSFEFPNEVVTTNGSKEGNIAKWTKTPAELADNGLDFTAVIRTKSKICSMFGIELPLVLLAGLAYYGTSRRKRKITKDEK